MIVLLMIAIAALVGFAIGALLMPLVWLVLVSWALEKAANSPNAWIDSLPKQGK